MKASGKCISSVVNVRRYSAQAAAKQAINLSKEEATVTRLSNGTVVAALETSSPVARVSVVFNGGSRSESLPGMAHVMRAASSLSSTEATAFSISRNIQQIGASLSCENTREHTTFSVNVLRNQLEDAVQQLSYVASSPVYKTWEVSDLSAKLNLDLANLAANPVSMLDDALLTAAFRTGLGNSLYIKSNRIGMYSAAELKAMADSTYVAGNMAIVGYGVDSESLLELVKKYFSGIKSGQPLQHAQSKFYGDEIRIDRPGQMAFVSIASEGKSLVSEDLLTQGVLQHVMGTGSYLKRGSNVVSSKLNKAATGATEGTCVTSAFSSAYLDTGLLGFKVAAPVKDITKVLKAVVSQMNDYASIQESDVTRGKNQLKAAISYNSESSEQLCNQLAVSTLMGTSVPSLESVHSAIDKITLEDVKRVAKVVIDGKPAMASVGDVNQIPYLESILN